MTKCWGLAGLVGMGLWLAASTRGEAPAGLRSGPPSWATDAVWYQVFPERFRNDYMLLQVGPGPRDSAS